MMRSIRFADDDNLCEYHSGAVMDMESACRKEIWYQHTDLAQIKRKARASSMEAQRFGLGNLLSNTYGKNSDESQEALNSWTRNASARRGLERWISKEYAASRLDIRRRTINSVLRAQRKMREEGVDDVIYCMEVLSRLSEAFSKDARQFGRIMGAADEYASRLDDTAAVPPKGKDPWESMYPRNPNSVTTMSRLTPRRNLRLVSDKGVSDMRHYY